MGHPATGATRLQASSAAAPRVTSHAESLTEQRLRQELARADAMLREQDLLIRTMLGWRQAAATHIAGLTRRQRQIMELVLAGQPSKNIAGDLGISRRTVENHRAAIMKKTGSNCLPALARMALAAAWDEVAAPPPIVGWRHTGEPDFARTSPASADWYRGSIARLTAPGRDAASGSRSSGNGEVALWGSSMPYTRQGASVTNFPTPVRRPSK